jgi:hypothetical protein
MTTTSLDRSMSGSVTTVRAAATGTAERSAPRAAATRKTGVLVGLLFLVATLIFAIGSALIHSYFFSATPPKGILIGGGLCLFGCGVAVASNGLTMRRVLAPHAPIRSQTYGFLRLAECLTLTAVGVYFLTGHARWDEYVLAVYAVSGAAGLVLSSALRTSRIVPRSLSMLGLIGYPVFLVGTVLAMFDVVDVTHGAGMLALVPGGLFELLLPMWLFTRGFASGGRRSPHLDVPKIIASITTCGDYGSPSRFVPFNHARGSQELPASPREQRHLGSEMSATPRRDQGSSGRYEIRFHGHLHSRWAGWFDGLMVTNEGDGTTLVVGAVTDQAALHGLLRKLHDLGLPLLSVTRLGPDKPEPTATDIPIAHFQEGETND